MVKVDTFKSLQVFSWTNFYELWYLKKIPLVISNSSSKYWFIWICNFTWEPGDEEVNEEGADDAKVLCAPEHGGARHVKPQPEHNLPKVVGMARERPQSGANELTLNWDVSEMYVPIEFGILEFTRHWKYSIKLIISWNKCKRQFSILRSFDNLSSRAVVTLI